MNLKSCALVAGLAMVMTLPAVSGVPQTQGDLGTGVVDCSWKTEGIDFEACVTPPKECPNGPFTGFETCSNAKSTKGCTGTWQLRGGWSGEFTGRQAEFIPCGQSGQRYFIMSCQCFGDLFGYCAGPCRPTGGVTAADVPCLGSVIRVTSCEIEG